MENLKEWLIETALNKMGPSAIRGAVLGVFGWVLIRNGLLAPYGIVSDAVTHTTTIHWDQLSGWAIAALPALLAAIIKGVQHTGTKAIKKGEPE